MPTDRLKLFLDRLKFLSFIVAIIGSAFSVTLCGVGIGGYLVGLLLEVFWCRKDDWIVFPQGRLVVALLASLVISIFVSDYLMISLRGFWKYLEGFILLYAAMDVLRSSKRFGWVLAVLAGVSFIAAFDGVFQDWFGRDFVYWRTAVPYQGDILRVTGPFKHSNDYATFLVPSCLLLTACLVYGLIRRKGLLVLLNVFMLIIFAYALTRSMSRAALLSVFTSLGVFCLFSRKRWWLLAVVGFCAGLLFVIPSALNVRMRELFDWTAGNIPERLILIKTTWAMVQSNPFFGLGLNTYSEHFADFRPADYGDVMYAHNSYLQMASEFGLVGLLLFCLMIVSFLVYFLKGIHRAGDPFYRMVGMGLLIGIIGFLVNSLFDSCFQATRLRTIFWIFMGLASALTTHAYYAKSNGPSREKSWLRP